jgi:uncharacterized protein YecT (DUF1311 family)
MRASAATLALLITLAPSLLTSPASAKEPGIDCASQLSTYEQQVCAEQDFITADAAMNAAYTQALARIAARENQPPPYDTKAYETAFRAAQRAWLAFRDADCKGVVPFAWTGGTGSGAAVTGCLTTKTKARTQDLDDNFGPQ